MSFFVTQCIAFPFRFWSGPSFSTPCLCFSRPFQLCYAYPLLFHLLVAVPLHFWSALNFSAPCLCFAALSFSFSWQLIANQSVPIRCCAKRCCSSTLHAVSLPAYLCLCLSLHFSAYQLCHSVAARRDAKPLFSARIRFCAGQINAQLCRAVASIF